MHVGDYVSSPFNLYVANTCLVAYMHDLVWSEPDSEVTVLPGLRINPHFVDI